MPSSAAATTRPRALPKTDMAEKPTSPTAATSSASTTLRELRGNVLCRWRPRANGPELLVMQGDLTSCNADAIVNAANSRLMHGGGLAGAIARKGGPSIQQESSEWIKNHGPLNVGDAVTTTAGDLPCKHVVHTVGPNVGSTAPTVEHSVQLRRAVWSALMEADRLEAKSVAVPGISTGIFGYPRALGAKEIVRESARFCTEKGETTKVERIALMNIDDPTVDCFLEAVREEKKAGVVKHERDISDELAALNIRE
ncbi:hypothetical protein PHYPSEUDO_007672 [Phytophthora pseudosyringae]|uniref:Macro domain-containing protein n=1 Tax=Phytophthora pseudosyringae TaxID=221518 RepID=A0A8T1VIX2_9STRA|nr:hypothetical protein PHYPSEUDO_007672 [Phytophthora pseudosyringae]